MLLVCNTTSLGISGPMGFDYFLIAMCTLYAVKTRNVPENFNEAKFIGFTMYTTIVIWYVSASVPAPGRLTVELCPGSIAAVAGRNVDIFSGVLSKPKFHIANMATNMNIDFQIGSIGKS